MVIVKDGTLTNGVYAIELSNGDFIAYDGNIWVKITLWGAIYQIDARRLNFKNWSIKCKNILKEYKEKAKTVNKF